MTPQELGFLAKLIEDGSEIEVSIAKSKLADESLFFMQEQEEDATSAPSSPTPEELNSRTKPPPLKSVCSEELARRQALLDERRNSYLHGQIWKAHQNGLAVTQASSRKSFMRREQSWTANRRSAAKHSNLLSSKEIAEIKEKLVLQRGSSFLIDGGSGSTRSRRASIGTYTRNNQRHQLPVLPPLGRTVSGPVASLRRMGSSSFSSQASAPRIPGYRPPTNIVPESGTSMKCQDTAPKSSLSTAQMGSAFQRRNNVAGAARPPLRRMSSAPVTPSGPLLLKQHDSTSTEDGSSPPPLPVGVPFRQQRLSNGGDVASEKDGSITKQATVPHHPPLRHPRRSTLRQLSSSSSGLVGIPEEEERKRSRQQQKIIENMRKEVQTSASSEWEGTVLPEEMEDKKMSDEEELELFRSHSQQSQSTEWLNALQLRRASVSSYGGEGMEIAATFLDYEYDQFDMAETVYEDEEKGSDQDMDKTLIEEYEEELTDDTEGSSSTVKHAAIMRRASINVYGGEGMEISDWDAQEDLEERRETIDTYRLHSIELQPAFGENERMAFRPCVSFDETKSLDRPKEDIVLAKNIPRSFSEDELSSLLTAQRSK